MSILPEEFFRYVPVSEQDVQWDLYVTGAGRSDVPPGSRYPRGVASRPLPVRLGSRPSPARVPGPLHHARRRALRVRSRPADASCRPATCCCCFPASGTAIAPRGEPAGSNTGSATTATIPGGWSNAGSFRPQNPILTTGMDDSILHPYLSLLDRVHREPVGYQQLIAANTMEILAAALAAVRSLRTAGRASAAIGQAKIVLEQRIEETVDMEKLAKSLHISYAHFRRIFKQQTGLSPYQYHLQLRINRAREMLHGTTLAVKQVARQLNFENAYHFSKIFKRKAGMSPSRWRHGGGG